MWLPNDFFLCQQKKMPYVFFFLSFFVCVVLICHIAALETGGEGSGLREEVCERQETNCVYVRASVRACLFNTFQKKKSMILGPF